ncbi:hypothetical protein HD806DRAFT_517185 [Xylariaceae sp. AK1471]|nr:hypothetical protein HD806DRAFT_517185 [Xylariaceae sp. AK1471]
MAEIAIGHKKRAVSSCLPCYFKKQKCSRQSPCNHCTRRRRPELCTYQVHTPRKVRAGFGEALQPSEPVHPREPPASLEPRSRPHTLSSVYGYVEHSEVNTLGLLRKLAGFSLEGHPDSEETPVSYDIAHLVHNELERMPARPIMDFLTRFFLSDVNWTSQLVHPPSFLHYYEAWWTRKLSFKSNAVILNVADVDFAVMILCICALATQYLPSPTHLVDRVRGVPLTQIKELCTDIASSLGTTAAAVDSRGSLFRVQHMCLAGLNLACEGQMTDSWTMLHRTVGIAQGLGYHQEPPRVGDRSVDELECEMRRRVLCNLYVWDGMLSRQLDHVPCFPGVIDHANLPRIPLASDTDSAGGGPVLFTERLLQAQIVAFWKSSGRVSSGEKPCYDPLEVEERYKTFRCDLLDKLPAHYALENPNCEWDEQIPCLPMQRQLLYISVFESICYNFRPLLLLSSAEIKELPAYKRVLIGSQSRTLAHAALSVLEAASTLHNMLGASHTRSTCVIFPMFEASVLLLCLCISGAVTQMYEVHNTQPEVTLVLDSSLGADATTGRTHCIQTAQTALKRLQMMGEVSILAEVGARNLSRLLEQISPATASSNSSSQAQEHATSSLSPSISWFHNFNSSPRVASTASTSQISEMGCFELVQLNLFEDVFAAGEEQHQCSTQLTPPTDLAWDSLEFFAP